MPRSPRSEATKFISLTTLLSISLFLSFCSLIIAIATFTQVYEPHPIVPEAYGHLGKTCFGNGKIMIGNSCYLFTIGSFFWSDAKAYCEALGGWLATLDNLQKKQLIISYFNSIDSWDYWTGLYNDGEKWRWLHTNEVINDIGLPSWDRCAYLSLNGWISYSCYTQRPAICEFN